MNFNFFNWIRQGVKQSVLMGVHDAVECIGTPVETDQVRETLLQFAGNDENAVTTVDVRRLPSSTPRTSGKLGRRLSDTLKKSDDTKSE